MQQRFNIALARVRLFSSWIVFTNSLNWMYSQYLYLCVVVFWCSLALPCPMIISVSAISNSLKITLCRLVEHLVFLIQRSSQRVKRTSGVCNLILRAASWYFRLYLRFTFDKAFSKLLITRFATGKSFVKSERLLERTSDSFLGGHGGGRGRGGGPRFANLPPRNNSCRPSALPSVCLVRPLVWPSTCEFCVSGWNHVFRFRVRGIKCSGPWSQCTNLNLCRRPLLAHSVDMDSPNTSLQTYLQLRLTCTETCFCTDACAWTRPIDIEYDRLHPSMPASHRTYPPEQWNSSILIPQQF